MSNDCTRMAARISSLLDRELTDREARRIRAHLATCSRCATTYRELRSARLSARSIMQQDPPDDFWRSIARGMDNVDTIAQREGAGASARIRRELGVAMRRGSAPADSGGRTPSGAIRVPRSRRGLMLCGAVAVMAAGVVFARLTETPRADPPLSIQQPRDRMGSSPAERRMVATGEARRGSAARGNEGGRNAVARTPVVSTGAPKGSAASKANAAPVKGRLNEAQPPRHPHDVREMGRPARTERSARS